MTHIPYIPETAPFTSEQRAWLNGFLAGLFAQGVAPQIDAPSGVASAKPGEPLLVLFGSQTGTAEGLARRVAKEAQQRGFAPKVLALNDYEEANLAAGGKAVIISSTWGDGDPPDNAVNFWNWLKADSAPRLEGLNFAVLGLGDKNYSDFCGASKKFDSRLEMLGARRLTPRAECDSDYETTAKIWVEGLWNKLCPDAAPAPANGTSNGSFHRNGATPKSAPAYGKSNPFPAKLLRQVLLNKPGSSKEVRHYEIRLAGSGLTYEAGDALGVVPANCVELVGDIIAALRCKEDEEVRLGGSVFPLREALTRHLDVTRPSQELVAAVARAAPASELARLLLPDKCEELKQWLWGRGVIDLLHLLPQPIGVTEFVQMLRKLAPRLYSIASSPKAHAGEAHLTVSALRYESFGRGRKGVASTFLADRVGDTEFVRVFVQPSPGFKPPPTGDRPMIMVGPGTGIAPFRAFLEDRQATGARGKNWLFFGEQTRSGDFLYEEQLSGWQEDGLLTRLDVAFSRDQTEKVYVQHRMLENTVELWSWLEAGAHFYVCGDASRMAKDVDAALHTVIEKAGQKSADDAKDYVAKLKSDKRYQRDVY
ncbi:MAG TPA: sulfite reductase subunit alpha [Candidatus Binatia bacterium]|jgi:sulfite reductase (NADPH) flavoprotein alpha-component|nr:sulfite reductase subunit alpha [Candidatus Binatia bacterium]